MNKHPAHEEFEDRIRGLDKEIARQRRTAKKLKDSEKRYRLAVDALNEGVILQEASGRIAIWNKSAEKIFGMTAEACLGRPSIDMDWPTIHPDGTKFRSEDHPGMVTLRTSEPCHDVPMGVLKSNGEVKWISINTKPVFYSPGKKPHAVVISFSDITERLEVEQDLLKEAVRRRILIEQSRDGIVVIDQDGKVHEANQKFADMLGYTLDEAKELFVWDWDATWDQDQLRGMIRNVDEAGDHFETRHRRRDGSIYDVEISTNGAVFEGQKMVFCVCRDITERKRAERILRESESRLQALSDASFEAIFFSDKGVCIDQNKTASRIFGYSDAEAVGRHGSEWIVPEDRELVRRHMMSGYERPYQVTALRKDGTTFPAEIQGRMYRYQDRPVRVTALRDITDRKKAEEALRESEERFRRLFEEAPIAIQGYYPDGTIHYWNKANEKTYGYTKAEAIGKNLIDLIIPAEMRAAVAEIIRHGAATGDMPPSGELSLKRKDGSRVPVLSAHVAIIRKTAETELFCLDSDLTEQKRLQAELQQAQKLEAIGTLTGGIAHDFNNILGIIIGNGELALDDVPDWNPAHYNLKEILKAGLRGKDIVRQLLTFSHKTEHNPKPIHLIPAFEDVIRFIRATIPATIDIRHEMLATRDTILSEPTVIYQVLMNLCSNSSQAMEATGGAIFIRMLNEFIDAHGQDTHPGLATGDYLVLTVRDTGPGIDPAIIDRIFDPYFTTKEAGKGTGMGLAVVKGIVESHKGAVTVTTRPGSGATFTVYLPITDEPPIIETDKPKVLEMGTETILFVDDEKSIIDMGSEMLTRLGYTVETAMTPQSALDLFQSDPRRFDLVITDMTMPQMTGLQLTKRIKAINPKVSVILCTGFSTYITPEKADAMGIQGYLMKPIVKLELANLVRKVLDASQTAGEGLHPGGF